MSATGIGASVRRKEDQRFITGKGRYTADIDRPGQAHAYFVRSPHAHAKIRTIETKTAAAMPGVYQGGQYGQIPGSTTSAPAAGPHHHYTFELFALDTKLDLGADATRADVLKAMDGHILGKGVLVV